MNQTSFHPRKILHTVSIGLHIKKMSPPLSKSLHLPELNCVRKIYPTDANFILVEVTNADTIYKNLVRQGIIVRNRTNVTMCNGCLRITVGKSDENDALLEALKKM